MFTRREILKSFLGLPLALAACETGVQKNDFDGEIVGASNNIGHILRERRNFEIPVSNWKDAKIVIVGGGIAGLTAAWKLKSKGFNDFVLLELEQRIGGTSASGTSNLVGYPWGAHYLPVPFAENEELIGLLDEMNLIEEQDNEGNLIIPEQYLTRDPEERVFYKGRWYEGLYLNAGASERDLFQLKAFQKELDYWIDWRDAADKRAFVVPISQCSNDAEVLQLDKISFAEWLAQKGFNSERLIWYCDYACRDDYGLKLQQTSAWAGLFYFCSRVKKSGVESQPFITFPEGNGKYVNHFVSKTQENIKRSNIVVELIPKEKGVDVIYLDTKANQINALHTEKIIFAAPLFTANYLIRGFRENPTFDVSEFQHNSWFVANLFLKDRPKNNFPKDFPLAWDNVLYESKSLGYVVATHQKGIDYGQTILTYYYPMATGNLRNGMQKLLSLDWKELADVCLTDLEQAHPNIRELTTRIDIMRWGHAMISPRTNFMWNGERQKAAKPFRNIHFAHSDLSGIAILKKRFITVCGRRMKFYQDKDLLSIEVKIMPFLKKNTEPKKQKYRGLFESEIALAKEIFRDTLPYDRIFIRNLKTATQGITLATRCNRRKANYILIWSNAFSTDITSCPDMSSTFIHELVHVWQGQYAGKSSMSYMRKSAWAQFKYGVIDIFKDGFGKGLKRLPKIFGKDFDREWGRHRNTAYCFDCEKIGEDFNTFNVEQQALIIESWFGKESFRLNGIEYSSGFQSENDYRFPYVRDCIWEGNPDAHYAS